MEKFIYKSSGQYFGFLERDNVFSWDGKYLGWVDEDFVWDNLGQFRGELKKIKGKLYILKNMYALPPLPKTRKHPIPSVEVPTPQAQIDPISIDIGWTDGFN